MEQASGIKCIEPLYRRNDGSSTEVLCFYKIVLPGGYIIQEIDENLTYDYFHSSEDNLWSILYLTGYLTRCKTNEIFLPARSWALIIPNAEILEIFETTIMKWFDDNARIWNRPPCLMPYGQKTVTLPQKK